MRRGRSQDRFKELKEDFGGEGFCLQLFGTQHRAGSSRSWGRFSESVDEKPAHGQIPSASLARANSPCASHLAYVRHVARLEAFRLRKR
jgi:hypothetical protein